MSEPGYDMSLYVYRCQCQGGDTHWSILVPDTLRRDQVRLETAHRRFSHSVEQAGWHLSIMELQFRHTIFQPGQAQVPILNEYFALVLLAFDTKPAVDQVLSPKDNLCLLILAGSQIFVFGGSELPRWHRGTSGP